MKRKAMALAMVATLFFATACDNEANESSTDQSFAETVEDAFTDGYSDTELAALLRDHGGTPFVVNIEALTKQNETFRTAVWTGSSMQMTVMSIPVGGEVGLEIHNTVEQFLRIEEGKGLVLMGDAEDNLDFQVEVENDDAILVPTGKWHNIKNIGDEPLKIYSIYAPAEHPFGAVHKTAEESAAAAHLHDH